MYLDDAYAIWFDLKERFSIGDSAQIYQLKQQLMSLSQGSSDVNTYFTNLRIVWDEFKSSQPISWCTCDSALKWNQFQENDCTMQFLIGLNPSFSQIRSHILSMIHLPSLSKAFSLVIQEERQRLINGNALSTNSSPIPPASELPYANAASLFGRVLNKFLCSHCRKTNHPVEKCFILHGFPPGFGRGRGKPPQSAGFPSHASGFAGNPNSHQQRSINHVEDTANLPSFDLYQQLISLLQSQKLHNLSTPANTSANDLSAQPSPQASSSSNFSGTVSFTPFINSISSLCSSSHTWILDTGATNHVCYDQSLFTSAAPISNVSVNLPNGNTAPVTHLGTIQLTPLITLTSVLHVPSFSFNLISVSALTQTSTCTVIFTDSAFQIQEASLGTVIGRGNRVGNLYIFDSSNVTHSFNSASVNSASVFPSLLHTPTDTIISQIPSSPDTSSDPLIPQQGGRALDPTIKNTM
ncbi:uncharacterized protein LOC121746088 [Salvia splendens]|uniref:uncharacterized protein LOC121746088 n=1 Tax=Salvia splendens TaxID=180675 RepID=UPI001C26410F|nr:uncharacterized protein LOC121746088 [Salvia splendens]